MAVLGVDAISYERGTPVGIVESAGGVRAEANTVVPRS